MMFLHTLLVVCVPLACRWHTGIGSELDRRGVPDVLSWFGFHLILLSDYLLPHSIADQTVRVVSLAVVYYFVGCQVRLPASIAVIYITMSIMDLHVSP